MKTLTESLGKPILFHTVLYQGKDGIATSPTGYLSTDPDVIGDQLTAIQTVGGKGCGVIALTYGPTVSSFINQAAMTMCNQCAEREMPFALCYDPWTVEAGANATAKAELMIAALQNTDTQTMMDSRSYISSINGIKGKLVLDFSLGITPSVVTAAVPGLTYWQNNADYAWPIFTAKNTPAEVNNDVKLPCLCIGFNDGTGPNRNMSVWNQGSPARIIPSNAGAYFWSLVAGANPNAEYFQFVTMNDVLEGTDIESFLSMLSSLI